MNSARGEKVMPNGNYFTTLEDAYKNKPSEYEGLTFRLAHKWTTVGEETRYNADTGEYVTTGGTPQLIYFWEPSEAAQVTPTETLDKATQRYTGDPNSRYGQQVLDPKTNQYGSWEYATLTSDGTYELQWVLSGATPYEAEEAEWQPTGQTKKWTDPATGIIYNVPVVQNTRTMEILGVEESKARFGAVEAPDAEQRPDIRARRAQARERAEYETALAGYETQRADYEAALRKQEAGMVLDPGEIADIMAGRTQYPIAPQFGPEKPQPPPGYGQLPSEVMPPGGAMGVYYGAGGAPTAGEPITDYQRWALGQQGQQFEWEKEQARIKAETAAAQEQWQRGYLEEQQRVAREQWEAEQLRLQEERLAELRVNPRDWISYWYAEQAKQQGIPESEITGTPPTPYWLAGLSPLTAGQPVERGAPTRYPSAQTWWTGMQEPERAGLQGWWGYQQKAPEAELTRMQRLWPQWTMPRQAAWQPKQVTR